MQHPNSLSLPQADADSLRHSGRVAAGIRERIRAAGGCISFAEYMHFCLYAPGLGYYSAGSAKFGRDGDFVTAPQVSRAFGALLAWQCEQVLERLDRPAILEIGAGNGQLAADLVETLAERDTLPAGGYRILEVSPDLQQRQQRLLRERIPNCVDRFDWLDRLPSSFEGVVIANEVLDAMPVERFVRRASGVTQVCVATAGDGFRLVERTAPDALVAAVARIETSLGSTLADGYASEICLAAPQWIADVAAALKRGTVLLFDYGVGRREYYAGPRSGGWLRCHFRHHVHDDPLILPGIQDLTSWVDFTAIAESAVEHGLHVAGFVSQAQFLIGAGLDRYMANFAEMPTDAQLRLAGGIKLLTLPTEMGENFKCLGLSRDMDFTPTAFGQADRAATLG